MIARVEDWQAVARGERAASAVLLAAHPDDETVGAGATLSRLRRPTVVHLTDGAPRDRRFFSPAFQGTTEQYAAQRRKELLCAMDLAGITTQQLRSLGGTDQESTYTMREHARDFAWLLDSLKPDLVITHAYEGGHPDHDACAFIAAAALRQARHRCALIEMPVYNSFGQEFIGATADDLMIALTPEEQEKKRRMIACFESQAEALAIFSCEVERFRRAPHYDFTAPPHDGPLHYEQWGWPMNGAEWRRLAARSLL